jgi:hypothetical protein
VFDIGLDASGRFKAYGTANTGVFASPHIVSLIEAAKAAPELRAIRLTTTSAECRAAESPIGIYVAIAAALLLAAAALALVLHRGAIRRVMRTLEAYRAWRRRRRLRGEGAAQQAAPSPAIRAAPDEVCGCELAGAGRDGKMISLVVSADQLAQATNGRERGVVVGRSKRLADLVVPEKGVSRRHVRLVLGPQGSLAIEDLESARGTKVNDTPVPPYERVPIQEGDRIALNGVVLTVKREHGPRNKQG